MISGSGLAMAKMIGFGAIERDHLGASARPSADRPKNTSAPSSASASVRAVGLDRMGRFPLVHALGAALVDHALGVAEDDVLGGDAHRLDQLDAGDAGRAGAVARPACVVLMSRPVSCSALIRPAAAMIAVPCWSSWKTGMSISSRSRCSMMKHSGALMSSRLMPPKDGPR